MELLFFAWFIFVINGANIVFGLLGDKIPAKGFALCCLFGFAVLGLML